MLPDVVSGYPAAASEVSVHPVFAFQVAGISVMASEQPGHPASAAEVAGCLVRRSEVIKYYTVPPAVLPVHSW